jgi:SMI1/KNR4 family protein SUKH-1
MAVEADWLDILETADYKWDRREPPASEDALAALAQFAGRDLPDDYIAFLRRQNGGALSYRDTWYFHFWRAEDIPSWSAGYGFTPDEIPGTLVFGDDGADEALVMDLREERSDRRYPIYAINYYSVEWKLAVPVAPNFRSLLLLGHSLLSSDDE